ncbi:MAG: FAD-dependent oxidoreductase [Saccharofermentanales bacterium]
MDYVAVIGGGISGCSAADRLAQAGRSVLLIEKAGFLGGNIIDYGCKADSECVKDNLCLVQGLFDKVSRNDDIRILYNSEVIDFKRGKDGDASIEVRTGNSSAVYDNVTSVVLATGMVKFSDKETGAIQWQNDEKVIWASGLENILYHRKSENIGLDRDIKNAVFIQCNGSRSVLDKADYCSRVCCGYSYRMARALKFFYPDIHITMMYMDLQEAGHIQDLSFETLDKHGIGYILCRPVAINKDNDLINIEYEDRSKGGMSVLSADIVILSEGMHPGSENGKFAGLFNLQIDEKGFLVSIEDEADCGVYLAGTVKGPRDIASSINDAVRVANMIISNK